jgi:hypothetical protein
MLCSHNSAGWLRLESTFNRFRAFLVFIFGSLALGHFLLPSERTSFAPQLFTAEFAKVVRTAIRLDHYT